MPELNPSVETGSAALGVRRGCSRVAVLLALSFVLQFLGATLFAADDKLSLKGEVGNSAAITIQHVEIGFAGHAKLGFFIPISIDLRARESIEDVELRITAPDSEGNACTWVSDQRLSLSPGAESTHVVGIRIGRRNGPVVVAAFHRNAMVAEYHLTETDLARLVRGTQENVLSLGSDINLSDANRFRPQTQETELVSAHLASEKGLPTDTKLWEGLDAVLLTTSDAAFWKGLSPATWQLLFDYVRGGGRLIVSCGSQGAELLGEGGPLRPFIPSEFSRVRRQRDTTGLEGFAGTTERLDLVTNAEGRSFSGMEVAQLGSEQGLVDAFDGMGDQRVAWIVRSRLGFGMVTLVAADLDSYPIANWSGRPRLVARILDVALGKPAGEDLQSDNTLRGELSQLGFRDISGQLRMAMDRFEGVTEVPFSALLAAIVGCILLMSVGDYVLTHRILRVPLWTWGTLPVLVLAICWGVVSAARYVKGNSTCCNQLEIVDLDFAAGLMRGKTWLHYFTPTTIRHDFSLQPNLAPLHPAASSTSVVCTWMGLPGGGLGGMDSSAQTKFNSQPYQMRSENGAQGSRSFLQGVELAQWSSHGFQGQWQGTIPHVDQPELSSTSSGRIIGVVSNPTQMKLRDCVLFHRDWCYEIGVLEPDGEQLLDAASTLRDVTSKLNRRQIIEDKEITSPWSKTSRDVPRIAEMLMFHSAAGGIAYTDLLDRYHRQLDASDIIASDAAVLVGRVDAPSVKLRCDDDVRGGEPKAYWGFVRIFLPVRRETGR